MIAKAKEREELNAKARAEEEGPEEGGDGGDGGIEIEGLETRDEEEVGRESLYKRRERAEREEEEEDGEGEDYEEEEEPVPKKRRAIIEYQ